jgi:hypothetical protein
MRSTSTGSISPKRPEVRYWPLAAAPVGDSRGSFRGQSSRAFGEAAWQLLTQRRRRIRALREWSAALTQSHLVHTPLTSLTND